jgi:hypothetical protein
LITTQQLVTNIFLFGILPDILIFYHMFIKKYYNVYLSQISHTFNFIYFIYILYIYDALTIYIILILIMYCLSFIIFFSKDNKINNKYWSQYDSFHLILCIIKIIHLYYIEFLNKIP